MKSKKSGLVYIPVRGWKYSDGTGTGTYLDDDTLTVTGKNISCLIILINSIHLKKEPLTRSPRLEYLARCQVHYL